MTNDTTPEPWVSDDDYAAFEAALLPDYSPNCDARMPVDPLGAIKQSVREIVRDELRKDRDLKSFAAASGMMSLTELCEFLGKAGTRFTSVGDSETARKRPQPNRKHFRRSMVTGAARGGSASKLKLG